MSYWRRYVTMITEKGIVDIQKCNINGRLNDTGIQKV